MGNLKDKIKRLLKVWDDLSEPSEVEAVLNPLLVHLTEEFEVATQAAEPGDPCLLRLVRARHAQKIAPLQIFVPKFHANFCSAHFIFSRLFSF